MSTLIRQVQLDGNTVDIAIEGSRIAKIAPAIQGNFDNIVDGRDKAAFPAFYNTHCHGAMTLLRGIADDMELSDWLNNHIWPAEAKLTPEDIYWGTRLACLEMIMSGTVFFSDMYFCPEEIARAADDSGLRASVGLTIIDVSPENYARLREINEKAWANRHRFSSRIQFSSAPHAIYTVSRDTLREMAETASELDLPIHIHLAETEKEFDDCMAQHGCTPAEYLDSLGLLTEKTLAAHSIYLTDSDMELMRQRRVNLAYIPCSNAKLCSGRFRFRKALDCGCRITLGTDGCASNNNLSMFDEMKFGALNGKMESSSPLGCTAKEILAAATRNGAEAFCIDAGVIQEGKLADLMLVDLNTPAMSMDYDHISNLVYAADSSCVSTVICDGNILMRDRCVPWAGEVIQECRKRRMKFKI